MIKFDLWCGTALVACSGIPCKTVCGLWAHLLQILKIIINQRHPRAIYILGGYLFAAYEVEPLHFLTTVVFETCPVGTKYL
jgi:hypothetical protein